MTTPIRSAVPRRQEDVVTYTWVQTWVIRALWGTVGVLVIAVGVAYRLSAQMSELKTEVREAQSLGSTVNALAAEVRLLRKGQDSLVTLMTDRERRAVRSSNRPLGESEP